MSNPIYHQKETVLNLGPGSGSATVALFTDGTVIVSTATVFGAATTSLHMDAASLRAMAALLNDAAEKLAPAEEAA